VVVPAATDVDQELCDEVERQFGVKTSPGVVRELRDPGVLVVIGGGRGSGGRHKIAHYAEDSALVVAMVERAKDEPNYKNKLHRAVLIAWARRTPIGTDGLRWAFREHYRVERRTAERLAARQQVKQKDPAVPDLNDVAFQQALAEAMLGRKLRPESLATMEIVSGPMFHEAGWRSGHPDFLPLPADGRSLGLVSVRGDGSVTVEALGVAAWEALSLAPKAMLARTAPRQELDAARECVRPHFLSAGFPDCSDLLVATEVPTHCLNYRKNFGDRWWESRGRRQGIR
jgi:hypothetical protein